MKNALLRKKAFYYNIFQKIANVRAYDDEITPISEPKGLPDDISTITELDANLWDTDGHSHTWLDASEITELIEFTRQQPDSFLWERENIGYLFRNGWGSFLKHKGSYPKEIEDIRFICWFDN